MTTIQIFNAIFEKIGYKINQPVPAKSAETILHPGHESLGVKGYKPKLHPARTAHGHRTGCNEDWVKEAEPTAKLF
ncbi:MAG: hypothetical protein R6V54_04535 [Desulfobacteraceae bacterium]